MKTYIIILIFISSSIFPVKSQDSSSILDNLRIKKPYLFSIFIVSTKDKTMQIQSLYGKEVSIDDLGDWLSIKNGKCLVVFYNDPVISYQTDGLMAIIKGSTYAVLMDKKSNAEYVATPEKKLIPLNQVIEAIKLIKPAVQEGK